jgi:hypothetical protein
MESSAVALSGIRMGGRQMQLVKFPPVVVALLGVVVIALGFATGKPLVAVVGVLVIALAAFRLLTGR